MSIILALCLFLTGCEAVKYRLTESEYALMPPLMHMDPYEPCQQDANALYCMSEYVLVSDKPSSLLEMIQEYSAHQVSHYNHSKLYYGICVTQTCQKFYDHENADLNFTLEACLNESLTAKYNLKVRILENSNCIVPGKATKTIDRLDIIVGTVCIMIIIANIVGSLFDYYFEKKKKDGALKLLLCFSMLYNLKKLTNSSEDARDPRLNCLESLHGIRVISTCLVIIVHSLIILAISSNPQFIEEVYITRPYHILLTGPLIMQTFLIISAFLLVYKLQMYWEKHQMSWSMLPRCIILRLLRLTPPYALILALTATWFAHLTYGPLWNKFVAVEMNDCRRYWWQNMLYINNYLEMSECMAQSWYIAADTQLYCMGVVVFLACRTSRSRKITLSLLFVAGLLFPAAHVYFQDLDGILIVAPETIMKLFITDPHFKNIYSRADTNITGYVIGMAMGYLVYHWQKKKVDIKKYQTPIYRVLYWSAFFLGLGCCYSGRIFYNDAPRQPLYVRVLYAAFLKTIFGLIIAILILGFIFKYEDFYRGILEWRGWKTASRLSYSAYLVHVALVRNYLSMQTSLRRTDVMLGVESCVKLLTATCIAAVIFWLLVEAPFSNLVEECLPKPKIEAKKEK